MDEAEETARHGEDAPEAAAACRAAALESICALDLGLDVEEEGWDSDEGVGRTTTAEDDGDGDGGDARSLERRAARLASVGSGPSLESAERVGGRGGRDRAARVGT